MKTFNLSETVTIKNTEGFGDNLGMRDILRGAYSVDYAREQGKQAGLGLSGELLKVAQRFQSVDAFLTQMAREEKFFTSAEGGEYLKRHGVAFKVSKSGTPNLPRCWSQYKSNILRGWTDYGINPKECATESEFRKKLNEARKAEKSAGEGATVKELAEGNGKAGVEVSAHLAAMLVRLSQLGAQQSDKGENMAAALAEIVMAYSGEGPEFKVELEVIEGEAEQVA